MQSGNALTASSRPLTSGLSTQSTTWVAFRLIDMAYFSGCRICTSTALRQLINGDLLRQSPGTCFEHNPPAVTMGPRSWLAVTHKIPEGRLEGIGEQAVLSGRISMVGESCKRSRLRLTEIININWSLSFLDQFILV